MALLTLTVSKKVPIRCEIEHTTAQSLDKYVIYAGGVAASDVVDKALEYVFGKDKEFAEFLETHRDIDAPPVLRVNAQVNPLKGVKRGPRNTSSTARDTAGKS